MSLRDSGLRWCVEHDSPHKQTACKIGRIPRDTDMCVQSIGQAWHANDPWRAKDPARRVDWPTPCRHVALLIGTEPVAASGQGVLL